MALARLTASAALAYALSLTGRSRLAGNAVWTRDRNIDDCARFCSHVLWGGNPGRISWVDTFKTSGDGSYHRGKAGLQPGDVVLFDWESNGVGNHVEFCLTSPASNGSFTTIGANGSDTVAVKTRVRNGYVLGYFRPAWGSASPTPAQPDPTSKERTVTARHYRDKKTGTISVIDPNGVQNAHVPNPDYVNLNVAIGVVSGDVIAVEPNVFAYLQSLVDNNRAGVAAAVWAAPIEGVQAAGKIASIDRKAGTATATLNLDEAATQSLAGKIVAGIKSLTFGAK